MKIKDVAVKQPLTEASPEFIEMLLTEQATGEWQEADPDALIAELDQMIMEAKANGQTKQ